MEIDVIFIEADAFFIETDVFFMELDVFFMKVGSKMIDSSVFFTGSSVSSIDFQANSLIGSASG